MATLYWQRYGSGHPLVMVHGWAMHSGVWRAFAEQLGQHFQVHCVDLPGHGYSQAIKPFNINQITQAIAETCDLECASWLGWSMGANVVMEMAKLYPERVDKLIVLAGNPCFCATSNWAGIDAKVLSLFAENLSVDCQAALRRFLVLQTQGIANTQTSLQKLDAALNQCDPPDAEILQGGLALLMNVDQRAALPELTCPALMILGDQDTLVPVGVASNMLALVPDWQVHVLKGAGHLPFLTQAERVSQLIIDFGANT